MQCWLKALFWCCVVLCCVLVRVCDRLRIVQVILDRYTPVSWAGLSRHIASQRGWVRVWAHCVHTRTILSLSYSFNLWIGTACVRHRSQTHQAHCLRHLRETQYIAAKDTLAFVASQRT